MFFTEFDSQIPSVIAFEYNDSLLFIFAKVDVNKK